MGLDECCDTIDKAQGELISSAFTLKTQAERPINFVEDLLAIEQSVNMINEAFSKLRGMIT